MRETTESPRYVNQTICRHHATPRTTAARLLSAFSDHKAMYIDVYPTHIHTARACSTASKRQAGVGKRVGKGAHVHITRRYGDGCVCFRTHIYIFLVGDHSYVSKKGAKQKQKRETTHTTPVSD